MILDNRAPGRAHRADCRHARACDRRIGG